MDGVNVCLCLLVIKTLDHVTDQAYPFVPTDWGGWPAGRCPSAFHCFQALKFN
jgi:hypothetical protein